MTFPAINLLKTRANESPDEFQDSIAILCQWIRDHINSKTSTTTTAEIRYHEGLYDALSLLATGTTEGYSHWQLLCGPPADKVAVETALAIEESTSTTKH